MTGSGKDSWPAKGDRLLPGALERRFLGLLLANLLLLASLPSVAVAVEISYATPESGDTGTEAWASAFLASLEDTGFTVKHHRNGQYGSPQEAVELVRIGLLEVCNCQLDQLTWRVPMLRGLNLPFLFSSNDHLERFVRSPEGLIREVNRVLPRYGLRLLDVVSTGGAQGVFTRNAEPKTLRDLAGVRLRAYNRAQANIYEVLGADSVVINWPETFYAIQTGVADGYIHSPQVVVQFGHTALFSHFLDVGLGYLFRTVVISEKFFQALTKSQREQLDIAVEKGRLANLAWRQRAIRNNLQALEDSGVTINTISENDREEFRKKLEKTYSIIANQAVVDFYQQGAAAYRHDQ